MPVFGINFGTVGFLAAVEREELEEGLRRAFSGDFEMMDMPGLEAEVGDGPPVALNDVSFLRRPEGRVAELSYRVGDEEVGKVRCDGLVAATPAGSTGYNLANGGPDPRLGGEGISSSASSPPTPSPRGRWWSHPATPFTSPTPPAASRLRSRSTARQAGCWSPGAEVEIRFREGVATLAQLPGANFYHRIREKFGRLAQ